MNDEQLGQMQNMLAACLNPDNDVRRTAEASITQHLNGHREVFIFGLMKLIRAAPQIEVRVLCAVILRQTLPHGDTVLFLRLPEELRRGIQTELIAAITTEPERYVRTQISNTISALASVLVYNNNWPGLFEALYSMCQPATSNPALTICALSILGELSDAADNLLPHVPNMYQAFATTLQPHNPLPVRVESTVACTKIITIIENKGHTKEYQKLTPLFFKTLEDTLSPNGGDDELAKRVLSALVTLATEEGKFYEPHLHILVPMMHAIGCDTNKLQLDDGIRQYACEVLVSTADKAPTMARKNQSYIRNTLLVCFSLLMDVEEDPQWGQKQDTNDFFDNSNADVAEDNLDRIATCIKGAKLWPVLRPLIEQHLGNQQDWRARHAGLIAMSQCCGVLQFEQIPVKEIAQFIMDPHPRVRFQAVQCLGQFPQDFPEVMQQKWHKVIFPGLMKPLEDFENPRIQSHAASALLNIIDGCPGKIVKLYLQQLMTASLVLLQKGHSMVQDRVMPVMACLAGQAPKAFAAYYDQVVPLMIYIIQNATGKDVRMLRARAMESVSYIGMYVGREKFHNDAKLIVNLFLGIMQEAASKPRKGPSFVNALKAGVDTDDEYSEQHMLAAWTRICSCLREEFVPILQFIMPGAFAAIRRRIEGEAPVRSNQVHRLVDAQGNEITLGPDGRPIDLDAQPEEEEPDTNVGKDGFVKGISITSAETQIESVSDKPNQMFYTNHAHTAAMEERATTMQMVISFCFDLGRHFMPYVKETAEIFIPLLDSYHDEIRSEAINAMPHLLRAAVGGYGAGQASVQFVKALFEAIAAQMLDTMAKEPDAEILQLLVVALQEVITEAGELSKQVIDQNQLRVIGESLLKLLDESGKRIERREKLLKDEEEEGDMDEERIFEIEERNTAEDAMHGMVARLIETLIKSHGTDFIPIFDGLFNEIQRMLSINSLDSTKRIAIFIIDDIFEHLGPHAAKYFPFTLVQMCMYATEINTEHGVRQAAAYGLQVAAKHCGPAFQPFLPEIAKRLIASIQSDPTYMSRDADTEVGVPFEPRHADDEGEPTDPDDEDAPIKQEEEEEQEEPAGESDDEDEQDERSRHSSLDNMVSALGAIAFYQNRPDLYPVWLSFLPLRVDDPEGPTVYGMLLDLLDQNHPMVIGENFANLPKILSIFLAIVGTSFLKNKDLRARVGKFFQLVKTMPPALLGQVVPALHRELQEKLAKIMAAI